MITVTKTFLPPIEEYQAVLKRAWDSGWITNRGELVNELEKKLKNYLGTSNILVMTNGTLPIQIAIKALDLKDEIITTPFSYVATTSSIVWENCKPVFVDIDPKYLTIDETKIEKAITSKTTAILATHVFGNPCNFETIEALAKKYNLKVIYDAAHCFGVTYNEKSVFNFGDVSTCSFHATKLFHSGEGGALFCKNELFEKIYYHHNFGHDGPEAFHGLGINAKMSELQAAMGLTVLPYLDKIVKARKKIVETYNSVFDSLANVQTLSIRSNTKWNYCYYPLVFENESILLKVKKALEDENIHSRRYFYPSLSSLPYIEKTICPIADNIASSILCMPLYVGLNDSEVKKIINIVCTILE